MENRTNKIIPACILAAVAAIIVIFVITVLHGEVNQDEGWYLYGAGLINSGMSPYIDFATTQGPVMQYFYSIFWFAVEKMGVMGGRIITAVLGLLAMAVTAGAVWRVLPRQKRMIGLLALICLAGLNVYQLYFFSLVKTYALAALLIGVSFLLLTFAGRGKHVSAFLAGVMIMLAAGTRLSAGAVIPAVLLCLLMQGLRSGRAAGGRDLRWLAYGAGAVLCMVILFLPFYLQAPEGLRFAMYEYHAGRAGAGAVYKAGFIMRLVRAYFPAVLALAGVFVFGWSRRKAAEDVFKKSFAWMILSAVLLVTLLHLAAPFPYDDYQAMLFPLFCAGIVVAGAGLLPAQNQERAAILILAGGLLFAAASPLNESMFIGKRDRIWWPVRSETSLQNLRRAAQEVAAMSGDDDTLLTQDIYLAVEAGMRVPAGMELGPFSLFPGWSREKAEKCRVMNLDMLREVIEETGFRVAALSEYSMAIRAPEVLPLESRGELLEIVNAFYEPVQVIGNFGQAETDLAIFIRRSR